MTKLEDGIFVTITSDELNKLKNNFSGYLERSAYPEFYEKIAKHDEIGRFHMFRLTLKD